MTLEPILDGPESRPIPPADASALKWPVLARLPWVGEPTAVREEQRARRLEPPAEAAGRREAHSPPSLRIADMPAELTRTYIDRAHAPMQPAEPAQTYDAIADSVAAEPLNREAASRQPRHRIDSGDANRFYTSASPVRSIFLPQEEPNTLAARIFQWHAAAAPYAGVVLTFLLAFSAGLLYWMTFGRPQSAPVNGEAPSAPIWTSESLDPTTIAQGGPNAPGALQDVKEFSWTKSAPHDKAPAKTKPAVDEAVKLDTPPLAAELADEKAVAPETAPITPTPAEPAQAAASKSPATIESPVAAANGRSAITYPTTPYAAFDFGLISSATEPPAVADQSSPQDTVAERPADGAVVQPSTR